MTGNPRRDIEVADGQVDHVGEALEVAITGSSILEDFDNTVEAFADGVGEVSVDEGQDFIEVIAQGCDELAQRRDTAAQCGRDPASGELLRRATVGVIPEVLKLVLEHPGAVDTADGVAQAVENAGMADITNVIPRCLRRGGLLMSSKTREVQCSGSGARSTLASSRPV
jgi:hypothetical protein